MSLDSLYAISPVDGRYYSKTSILRDFFSEYALMKYRVKVEIEYFIALVNMPLPQLKSFNKEKILLLRNIYLEFNSKSAERIKEIEKTTNHDVKAVEYFIKEKFDLINLSAYKEFIHFGLTSQDINNTAVPLSVKDAMNDVYYPVLGELLKNLDKLCTEYKDIPMLAKTHGQPASPTNLGKELNVFSVRIKEQLKQLKQIPLSAKFGGATGNFNAHYVSYPETDWNEFALDFVNNTLGLNRSYPTTQIEHYDNIAAMLHCLSRINNIFVDFSRDIWTYISMDYFKQKIKEGEVGSSAMPHKVNPIDFENAEGNLGMSNAIMEFLAAKLPVSRLQRDLTDSTVLRNIGVPFAHILISFESLKKGMSKLFINKEKIDEDLENNWIVVAEAIQTILRRENYPNPYEALKELTRTNKKIDRKTMHDFIAGLNVKDDIKNELYKITPFNYTGVTD
ncbi:MAG: adenylosuccinate lyase [Bacteroidales bacterium]|jgi:adenylosuccinate lyase|nr:adenylosuccinate lyase [Bacteroidales bacterium]